MLLPHRPARRPARRFARRLRPDETGGTIVEFAFVAPVFVLMLIGVFDIAHTLYTSSMLQGTMQKAGRDFTLENAASRQTAVETFVLQRVQDISPSAAVTFERKAYFDFADVGEPEAFDDLNGDGACNNNEPFEDDNNNGQWDDDRGEVGFGGARDAVMLTATITYDRLFPMAGLAGLPEQVVLEASTVLRNQPFDRQDQSVTVRNCP